jgi:uncharacterized protein VirK/YbjX
MGLNSSLVANGIDMIPKTRSIVMDPQERSLLGHCFRILLRSLTNIGAHRRVFRLLKLSAFTEAVRYNPKFAIKYLTDLYLARGLTVSERASCFLYHYDRLYNTFPYRVLYQSLHLDVLLFEISECGQRFSITMGMSRPCDKEGEMSLLLKLNGEIVFTLSFTIIPGQIVKSDAKEVLLISRLQSMPGSYYEQIKSATKIMHRVHPRALLIAALEGVAAALGISEVAAVRSGDQVSYDEEHSALFKHGYDDFWAELRMVENGGGFFLSALPFDEKPISSMKRNSRLSAKKRRAFKQQIKLACRDSLLRLSGQIVGPTDDLQDTESVESHPDLELSQVLD